MLRRLKEYLAAHRTPDLALIALISSVAASKWFNLDFPTGHDTLGEMLLGQMGGESVFNRGMLSGWTGDWYLGLPLFQVHPPLIPFLITVLSLPFGWVLGMKILYLSFYILSGLLAYLYVYEISRSRLASFVAGLAYVFAPYHVLDMAFEGHQGAFGLPYMLTPLILLSLERLLKKPTPTIVIITALLLAALTLSYPQVFPFLIGPFLVLYVLFRSAVDWKRGRRVTGPLFASLLTFCLALLLTAFWWLPLISDIQNFQQTQFPLEDAKQFSATFLQAITLRMETCCAPDSAYGASGSALLETLRILPLLLVLLGVILNVKNRWVWFFSASVLITWLLAMGPYSPLNVFGFAHNYIPLFSGIRTPVRFLLFTSLAYAVLIGFCTKAITEWLKRTYRARPDFLNLSSLALLIISLVIIGNTWQETRTAFGTFTLTTDRENAYAWLNSQEDGAYRMTSLPFETWVSDPDAGNMINPTYWTYLHGRETVGGGVPAMAVKYTGSTLESLNSSLETGPFDASAWLNVFNVKYLLVEKANPVSSNIIIGEDFARVWTSGTIDIYENRSMLPRVFSFAETNERVIELFTGDAVNLAYGEGTQEATVSLTTEHHLHQDLSVKSVYHFAGLADYLCLEANVEESSFGQNDAIRLAFYSERDLPDVHLSLGLYERDDSRYDVVLNSVDGIDAGWNEATFPLSLLNLRYSVDENAQLDTDQIDRLSIGVGKQGNSEQLLSFELYFDQLSVVTNEANSAVTYTKVKPGKYEIQVNSDSPFYLVLSESYHPNWVARFEGKQIASEMIYGCLNSFYLEAGEYVVALEFTTSPLRKAATIISAITLLTFVGLAVFLVIVARRPREPRVPVSADTPNSDA
jgi:hypothetical protein